MMSLTLSVILVLIISQNFLSTLAPKALTTFCISISLIITYALSVFAVWNANMQLIAAHKSMFWNFFLIRNCLISAIVSAVILRYFYVQHQWKSNIQTEARFVVTFRCLDDKLEISRRHVAEVRKFLKVK